MNRKFASGAVVADEDLGPREVRVVASTPSPDRAGDVMVPKGCEFKAYAANPIVLADHDPTKPIGVAKLAIFDDRVEALVTFAPEGVSPKADEYCGLAKARILNAVSVGFRPVESEPIKGGGYRFLKWELMELSFVAVPCNSEALVVQRSAAAHRKEEGASQWKVGASRNLPIGDDAAWDGPAAQESIFDHAGFDGDAPDSSFARKGFLVYDAANAGEKGAYKLPFAKMVDGRLTAMPAALRAAASRLPQADIPDEARAKARAVLDHYEARIKERAAGTDRDGKGARGFVVKRLSDVANLAWLLQQLGWAHAESVAEALAEGDQSKVPGMLAEALSALAAAFVAMSAEETRELLASGGVDAGMAAEDGADVETAMLAAQARRKVWSAAFAKAGAALSAENRGHRDAIGKSMKAAKAAHAEMSNSLVKAADLHDYLRDQLDAMQGHLDEAAKSAAAMGRKKPDAATGDAGDASDPDNDDDSDPDAPQDDRELAAAARRKRIAEALALG